MNSITGSVHVRWRFNALYTGRDFAERSGGEPLLVGWLPMAPETHRLVVPRAARFFTLGNLERDLENVWMLCHGYSQLASEFLEKAEALASETTLLVAPEALSRFYHEDHQKVGASWMTREDRLAEIEDYVRYLDLVYDHLFAIVSRETVRLRLLGFSQGAATAARWAVRGRAKIDELVLWGSSLPPEIEDESSMARLREMQLTVVSGTRDPFLDDSEREVQRARLVRHGLTFEELRFEGGHRLDDDRLRHLANRSR
ncbi:MAG TPA: hypothetical protein VLK65_04880 [Vicinamibacteria bacterium]|nr:hypothetical protein [Vicinamibacteria bacterium]